LGLIAQNQAIAPGTATFDQVRALFREVRGPLEECRLMTSYRSTPEITQLFASLLDDDERLSISSIQRADTAPEIIACASEQDYDRELRRVLAQAVGDDGLTAVVVPQASGKLLREARTRLPRSSTQPPAARQRRSAGATEAGEGLEFDRHRPRRQRAPFRRPAVAPSPVHHPCHPRHHVARARRVTAAGRAGVAGAAAIEQATLPCACRFPCGFPRKAGRECYPTHRLF
ncbi:MAG: hypothetical protein ACLT98_12060, partial [Eggerthellaceae bacterium]